MFWANSYASSSHIEALLNREDVTLYELMDDEDILQECRSQNKKLVEYLTRSEIMEELVSLTTKEPSIEIEERLRYKYPNIACELLTCDIPTMNEKLAGDVTLLAKLYSFIDTDQPLNPLLASFFSKTIGVLISRKSDQVLEFLKGRQTCVDLLLRHVETSAIMDLILKLVTKVEGDDTKQNTLSWLDSQQLVQRLVKLLSPSSDPAKHSNAAQLLFDMTLSIRRGRRTSTCRDESDPILNTLQSESTVSLVFETIFSGKKLESSIVGGIRVIVGLLGYRLYKTLNDGDIHTNGSLEEDVNNEQRIQVANATIPYLKQLHELLIVPPYKPPIRTTAGVIETPVGDTRLAVTKLLFALLKAAPLNTEDIKIYETLVELGTFQVLLNLFFKYMWNNFLHTKVEQCLALALSEERKEANDIIYPNLFIDCKLIERILEAWDRNDNEKKENGVRHGYMGHLTNIADNIVAQCKKNEGLDKYLKANLPSDILSQWERFVSGTLSEIISQQALDCPTQAFMANLEGNPNEYQSYCEEAYLQQAYSYYHSQQVSQQFIENFGYHDDQFNDAEDALHNSVDQLTTLVFNLSEEDLVKREELFNEICQQKQKVGLEDSSSTVEWGDEGEITSQTVVEKRDWPAKQQQNDSNDSSDEGDEDTPDINMEIDSTDPWNTAEPLPTSNVLPEVNPWDTAVSEPVESTGWANFDNFESSLSIDTPVAVEEKTSRGESKKDADSMQSSSITSVSTISEVPTQTVTTAVTTAVTETVTVTSMSTDKSKKETEVKVTTEDKPREENGDGDSGDGLINNAGVVTNSSSSDSEEKLDNKKTEEISCESRISNTDKNANPSSDDVLTERENNEKVEESVKNSVDSEKFSDESCCLKNDSPEEAVPGKDAK